MKKLLVPYFTIPYLVLAITTLMLIISYAKPDLHLMLTRHRCIASDTFFSIWTQMGATIPYIIIFIFLFYKYSIFFFLAAAQAIGSILSFTLKRLFNEPRPIRFFQEFYPNIDVPHIEGMRMYTTHSMPSGHTIAAFALFFGIALISKNKYVQFFSFIAAGLVGYSRIYLSQHFTADVLAGSLVGIGSAAAAYFLYIKWDKKLENKSLRDIFIKKN